MNFLGLAALSLAKDLVVILAIKAEFLILLHLCKDSYRVNIYLKILLMVTFYAINFFSSSILYPYIAFMYLDMYF